MGIASTSCFSCSFRNTPGPAEASGIAIQAGAVSLSAGTFRELDPCHQRKLEKTNSTDIDADKELALLREKYLQLMKRYTPELEKKCKERSSEMSAYLLSLDKSIRDPLECAEAKREVKAMQSSDILCRLSQTAFFCKSLYESFVRQRTTSSFLLSLQHSDMDNFNNLLDFYDTHCQPPK